METKMAPLQNGNPNGKTLGIRVQLLDETFTMFHVPLKAIGRVLFDDVCSHLNLIDTDYFGLEFKIGSVYYWLDHLKPITRQLDPAAHPIRFCVKFYTPDPAQLEDEFTRYLFTLQIKRDLREGELRCSDATMQLMHNYLLQAERGDWAETPAEIMGQTPAEADMNLLETARRCDLYGVKMHECKDADGVDIKLAVTHLGICVYQGIMKINTFSWGKIRKLSFKRKRFLIKLHLGATKSKSIPLLVEFLFETRDNAKSFWKKCVEHHGFFRCANVSSSSKHRKGKVLSRGSSFRYSGKTQKQLLESVRDIKRQTFQRGTSIRQSTNSGSITAHPLLPIATPKLVNRPQVAVSPIQLADHLSMESVSMDVSSNLNQSMDLNSNHEDNKEHPVEVNVITTTPLKSQPNEPITIITNTLNEDLGKKNRYTVASPDIPFFIAKEILMTEKTYKKDLDVINQHFRNFTTESDLSELLLSLISPLATVHTSFLHDLDQCLQTWHSQQHPLGSILLNNISTLLPLYEEYLDEHTVVLEGLIRNDGFGQQCREFEGERVCYLPFSSFVLKPLHRLVQYHHLLLRLLEHYPVTHLDRPNCQASLTALLPIITPATETLRSSENLALLHELQADIQNFDLLSTPRTFIRHGCLLKQSRKGFQQRMFFLFSDILLYTSRGAHQFRVHGHMPLRGVMLDADSDATFTIYGGNRALTVMAQSVSEKEGWVKDLADAIQTARDHTDSNLTYLSLKSCSSDELIDKTGDGIPPSRTNTTVQVCWHRNTTISIEDQLIAVQNQLSGYLLRKFKNSNGWQKLWVVFTGFSLFFYKSSVDDFPLASLPLLGYVIAPTGPQDQIGKEFVFKLQYKNHIYFFRAESEYTFGRWLQVIGSVTHRSG